MGRVLLAFEKSGVGRRAFAARGHETWSCDLQPAEDGSNRHIVDDVRSVLHWGWDLLVVAHPPCTRLCRSGRRWLSGPGNMTPPRKLPKGRTWASMIAEFDLGVELFLSCWNSSVERVAIENPEMHDIARARMPASLPKPQMVQPFWFGEPEYKNTGWYLRGLPPLVETSRLPEPVNGSDEWKSWNRVHRMSPGPDRANARSRSYTGMMEAAADQWGRLLPTLTSTASTGGVSHDR